MAHPIERKISERETQISDIERQIRDLEMRRATISAEVAAYRDTLQYLVPPASGKRRQSVAETPRESGGGRGISSQWATLLKVASEGGTSPFEIDSIVFAGEISGYPGMKRPSVRTQAANMVTRGVLERVTPGTFKVTESGLKEIAAALDAAKQNGEAKASPDREQDANPAHDSKPSLPGA